MALTLTYDEQLSRVRVVADGLFDASPVRVERSTDQVRWSTVRGASALTPVGGAVRVDDYEFTPGVPNYYRVVGPSAWDTFGRVTPARLNSNPFFEVDAAGWTAAGGTFTRSTVRAHEGAASGLLTPDGVSASVSVRSNRVAVTAGLTYRVSAWVYCAVSKQVNLQAQWFDSGGVELTLSAQGTTVAAATWTLLDTTFVAPAGAVQGNMRLSMGGTPLESHLLYIDEASMLAPGTGWGSLNTGQTWSHLGNLNAFRIDQGTGRHLHTTLDTGRHSIIDAGSGDSTLQFTVAPPVMAAGMPLTAYAVSRIDPVDPTANQYQVRVAFLTDGRITCTVRKRVNGDPDSKSNVALPGPYIPGDPWVVKIDTRGATIRGKIWRAAEREPDGWLTSWTDPDPLPSSWTRVGITTLTEPGSTNTHPLEYRIDNFVVTSPEASLSQASITPTADQVWLKSVARPFLNRPVHVRGFSDITRPSRTGTFDVIGRSFPVAVTDLRSSRRWTLELYAQDAQEAEELDLMLASGDILYLQVPASGRLSVLPTAYVTVGDSRETLLPTHDLKLRVFALPCTEVAAPGPDVVGATSNWQTVLNTYATWEELLADNATWADLLELVGDPTDVIVQ